MGVAATPAATPPEERPMNYQTVADWKNANPFHPFRLVMTDGRWLDVLHPGLVWPGTATVLVGIQDPAEPVGVFGSYVSVATLHIVRVEPLAPTPAA
jgi:hypothetical protein